MKYQYTITGKIIQGPGIDDAAGYLKRLGLSEGSPVSYTFIIDLLVVGFKKQSDGLIVPVQTGEACRRSTQDTSQARLGRVRLIFLRMTE